MLAIRQHDEAPTLKLGPILHRPVRASIGARRNPESTRAILEAAEAILGEDGLAGLSMDAIARRARCGKPTLYRWWPDKASLLAEIHERTLPTFSVEAAMSIERITSKWIDAWRTTLAGVALRGMLAEAQSSADAQDILQARGLAPYRSQLQAILTDADQFEWTLREVLAPLLGMLMLGTDPVPVPTVKAAMREVRANVPAQPGAAEGTAIRHRGEWVD